MSRLESFIRRLRAQRDILNDLGPRLDGIAGPIFEFGFGGGRTYDHLRQVFPDRRIIVFECAVIDNPLVRLPAEDLVIGDIRETASAYADGSVAMIHADIETGVAAVDAGLRAWLPDLVARLLASGGFAASGCALPDPRLAPHPLPEGIGERRYCAVQRL